MVSFKAKLKGDSEKMTWKTVGKAVVGLIGLIICGILTIATDGVLLPFLLPVGILCLAWIGIKSEP